jgi:hypothetical protein
VYIFFTVKKQNEMTATQLIAGRILIALQEHGLATGYDSLKRQIDVVLFTWVNADAAHGKPPHKWSIDLPNKEWVCWMENEVQPMLWCWWNIDIMDRVQAEFKRLLYNPKLCEDVLASIAQEDVDAGKGMRLQHEPVAHTIPIGSGVVIELNDGSFLTGQKKPAWWELRGMQSDSMDSLEMLSCDGQLGKKGKVIAKYILDHFDGATAVDLHSQLWFDRNGLEFVEALQAIVDWKPTPIKLPPSPLTKEEAFVLLPAQIDTIAQNLLEWMKKRQLSLEQIHWVTEKVAQDADEPDMDWSHSSIASVYLLFRRNESEFNIYVKESYRDAVRQRMTEIVAQDEAYAKLKAEVETIAQNLLRWMEDCDTDLASCEFVESASDSKWLEHTNYESSEPVYHCLLDGQHEQGVFVAATHKEMVRLRLAEIILQETIADVPKSIAKRIFDVVKDADIYKVLEESHCTAKLLFGDVKINLSEAVMFNGESCYYAVYDTPTCPQIYVHPNLAEPVYAHLVALLEEYHGTKESDDTTIIFDWFLKTARENGWSEFSIANTMMWTTQTFKEGTLFHIASCNEPDSVCATLSYDNEVPENKYLVLSVLTSYRDAVWQKLKAFKADWIAEPMFRARVYDGTKEVSNIEPYNLKDIVQYVYMQTETTRTHLEAQGIKGCGVYTFKSDRSAQDYEYRVEISVWS